MAAGDIQSRNGLADISNILTLFKGSGKTTQTDVSSEEVSDAKTKALLQSILESTNGLAAVSSGQKQAGLYSSTVNTQLTNDLLARAAAQTAALSSKKTNTSTRQTGPQADPVKSLLSLVGGQVVSAVAKKGAKKVGLDKLGDNISDAIFGSPTATAGQTVDLSSFNIPTGTLNSFDISNSEVTGADTGAGGSTAGGVAAGALAGGITESLLGSGAALTDASYAIGGTGTFMSSAGSAAAGEAASSIAGSAATDAAATGALEGITAGGVGEAALGGAAYYSSIAIGQKATDSILSEVGVPDALLPTENWIICTELHKQGRLPYRYYVYGSRAFAKYDERGKQGYYIWAIPSVRHLRKYPNSAYSHLMEVVFNARAEYLAAVAGCKGARKTALGAVTTHGLYVFCWLLSRTIARKAYTQEQILNIGA